MSPRISQDNGWRHPRRLSLSLDDLQSTIEASMTSAPSGPVCHSECSMTNFNSFKWTQQCSAYAVGACDGPELSAVLSYMAWHSIAVETASRTGTNSCSVLFITPSRRRICFRFDVWLQVANERRDFARKDCFCYVKLGKIRNSFLSGNPGSGGALSAGWPTRFFFSVVVAMQPMFECCLCSAAVNMSTIGEYTECWKCS